MKKNEDFRPCAEVMKICKVVENPLGEGSDVFPKFFEMEGTLFGELLAARVHNSRLFLSGHFFTCFFNYDECTKDLEISLSTGSNSYFGGMSIGRFFIYLFDRTKQKLILLK